jgi:hypothetical protein
VFTLYVKWNHSLIWVAVSFSFKSSYFWTFSIACVQTLGPQPGISEYLVVFIVSLALVSEDGSRSVLRNVHVLSAFAEFRKATVSIIMSVYPSICMEKLGSSWRDFYEFWYWSILRKSVGRIQVPLKSGENNGNFTLTPVYTFDHI